MLGRTGNLGASPIELIDFPTYSLFGGRDRFISRAVGYHFADPASKLSDPECFWTNSEPLRAIMLL